MRSGSRLGRIVLVLLFVVVAATARAQTVVGVMGIPSEVGAIEKRLQDSREVTVKGHVFRVGTIEGHQVAVGRSGAGKVNAAIVATLLVSHFSPSALFFSGTAGAIDQTLGPGDVVIGAAVAQHDTGIVSQTTFNRRGLRNGMTGEIDPLLVRAPESLLTAARRVAADVKLAPIKDEAGERAPRIVEGVIVTGDMFVADAARRDELRESFGAVAVEMEGAAMVQACRQFGVPCLVVRSITDRANGLASASYDTWRATASENAAIVVAAVISRLDR